MENQTISGKLFVEKASRPPFAAVILNWMIYFMMSRFLIMMYPNPYVIFIRYFVFFIALISTFRFLFTPHYYTVFKADKDLSGENQKLSPDSSTNHDLKSESTTSSIEEDTNQTQGMSSDKTSTSQFCAECGVKVEYSGRFCTACGNPIRV